MFWPSQTREPGPPPSPASQIDQARRPVPKPARSIESGPQNHESGQGPHAGQVGRVRTHKTARMIKSQTTIQCLMKPAASAAPQGGCVDSQLDAALAILRNEGRLREQPTFTINLGLSFATSCFWSGLRSGTDVICGRHGQCYD